MQTLKQLKQHGVVTKGNSKIHGSSFSTSPWACNVGQSLVNVEGSTCSNCYAIKMGKVYPSAKQSWQNNLDLFRQAVIDNTVPEWCEAMAQQIMRVSDLKARRGRPGSGYHRWFTAGDLDSYTMLLAFLMVARLTPSIRHWLPTREKALVRRLSNDLGQTIPPNMVIRVSAAMIDGAPLAINGPGIVTSTVHKQSQPIGLNCPSYSTGGSCATCSACWSNQVANVSYPQH